MDKRVQRIWTGWYKEFYEGMQSALSGTTIDDDVVHFIGIRYCLEDELWGEYFVRIIHTKVSGKIQKILICINIVLIIDHRSYLK